MKFKALRSIYGDYGVDQMPKLVPAGEVFEVPSWRVRDLQELESSGTIARHFESLGRKAYIVTANKMLRPPENKKR